MNGRYWFLAAAIVATFVAIVWFMDPFLLYILGIGLPIAIVSGFRLLFINDTAQLRRHWRSCLCGVAEFACFVGLAIPSNHFVQERAVATAKEYPAQVAPLLEAYRQAHGSYPTSLEQLPDKPGVPRLLRGPYGYRSHDGGYSFSFGQPGGLIDTWCYGSETGTWHLST